MIDRAKRAFKAITPYRTAFGLWAVVGAMNLAKGDISRLSYLCAWACLMVHLWAGFKREDQKNGCGKAGGND